MLKPRAFIRLVRFFLPFSVKFLGDVYMFGIQGLARFVARNPSGVIYVDIA